MPSRLFASTYTTRDTLLDARGTREQRLEWFTRRLRSDFEATEHIGLKTIDMFVFPVVDGEHFYVMSVCLKNKRFDIIDSSSAMKPNPTRYRDAPESLLDLLASFLDPDQPLRALWVRNLKPKRMQMPWREPSNQVDSGVFAMRHMESFIGKACDEWDCGSVRGDGEQILNLRKRFMHNILFSDINGHKRSVSSRVAHFVRQMSG